ncbi:Pentatricopeptide repeat-containing protein DOT4, chloroplastic [Linum grandiflorum]
MSNKFSSLPLFNSRRPLYLWNLKIRDATNGGLFDQSFHLYRSLLSSGIRGGSNFTYPLLLKAASSSGFHVGETLHSHILHLGFQSDVYVQTSLLDMYSKCSDLVSARKVFDEMPERNVVSWNSMISAYCNSSLFDQAVSLLNEMRKGLALEPNSTTFVVLLSACGGSLLQRLSAQCCVFKMGLLDVDDVPLTNAVMGMLVNYGRTSEARAILDKMPQPSLISWTTVVNGYVESGNTAEAFSVFNQMRREIVSLDFIAFLAMITCCGRHGDLSIASSVHLLIIKTGCDQENAIVNLLVSMYAKCGDLESARLVFDLTGEKSISVWTSMMSMYNQSGHPAEALAIFNTLLRTTTVKPDAATLATVLSACANTGSLSIGEGIEEYITRNGFQSDQQVQTSLIHMFCKCGSVEKARTVFDGMSVKDLTAWSSMINGYAIHGMGNEALSLFHEMLKTEGIVPDSVTYTSVLLACNHSGLVEDGLNYFRSMQKDFGIEPSIEHYTCLVDLLGRAGRLDLAMETTLEMPGAIQARMWPSFLSSCQKYGDIKLAEFAAERMSELNPDRTGNYVLMANLYMSEGKWKEAAETRSSMDNRQLVKKPAWSQVEINGSVNDSIDRG